PRCSAGGSASVLAGLRFTEHELSCRGGPVWAAGTPAGAPDLVGECPLCNPDPTWLDIAAALCRQVPGRARRSEPHVRPWRGVAANPLALAGLGGALAVGQYRLAAAEDGPRPAGDCPAVVDGVSRP